LRKDDVIRRTVLRVGCRSLVGNDANPQASHEVLRGFARIECIRVRVRLGDDGTIKLAESARVGMAKQDLTSDVLFTLIVLLSRGVELA
jgi:hypothetical protein